MFITKRYIMKFTITEEERRSIRNMYLLEQITCDTQNTQVSGGTQPTGSTTKYTIPIKDDRFQQSFNKIGYNGNFNVDRIQNLIYIFNSTTPAGVPTKASFPLVKPKDFNLKQGTWTYDPDTKSVSFQ